MFSAKTTHLLALMVLAIALRAEASSSARQKPADKKAAAAEQFKLPSWEVFGMGENRRDALEVAVGRARDAVKLYMLSHTPPVEWPGMDHFLKEHVTEDKSVTPLPADEGDHKGEFQSVRLRVELSQADYQAMLRLDRQYRAQQRQLALLKIVVTLIVVLAGVSGYVWFNESTRGSYSRWLRLAAASLVGIGGAGWWLLS